MLIVLKIISKILINKNLITNYIKIKQENNSIREYHSTK